MVLEQIKVKDLLRANQKELTVNEQYEYDDLPTTGPVDVKAYIELNSTGLVVKGRFAANVEEPCDRCYEPFERTLHGRFEDRFVYQSLIEEHPAGAEVELHDEDFYDTLGADGLLDLKDLIYQHIILAMSSNRVCEKENCTIRA